MVALTLLAIGSMGIYETFFEPKEQEVPAGELAFAGAGEPQLADTSESLGMCNSPEPKLKRGDSSISNCQATRLVSRHLLSAICNRSSIVAARNISCAYVYDAKLQTGPASQSYPACVQWRVVGTH